MCIAVPAADATEIFISIDYFSSSFIIDVADSIFEAIFFFFFFIFDYFDALMFSAFIFSSSP